MKLRKLWAFLAGLCGILAFYLTVAVVVVYIILDRIEAETGATAGLFDNWYQTLMFVFDLIFVLGMAAFITLAVLWGRKKKNSTAPVAEIERAEDATPIEQKEGEAVESV